MVCTLENALCLDGTHCCEQQFFTTVLEDQQTMCQLHSVVIHEGSDSVDALLRHLFTSACGLWRDEGEHVACSNICRGLQGSSDIVSTLISIVL